MVRTKVQADALAQAFADIRQWSGATGALNSAQAQSLMNAQRMGLADFERLAPGADPGYLVGLWVVRGVREALSCDPALSERLTTFLTQLLYLTAADAECRLWQNTRWCTAIDRLLFHWQCWYGSGDLSTDRFLQRCDDLLLQCRDAKASVCLEVIESFNRRADKELDRAALLASRIADTERGKLKRQQAEERVTALLNECFSGNSVPDAIYRYITQSLSPALQFCLINDREHLWEFWTEMLTQLVQAFSLNKTAEQQQAFFRQGPQLGARLSAAAPPPGCEPNEYHEFVTQVIVDIEALLAGQRVHTVIAPPAPASVATVSVKAHPRDGEPCPIASGDWLVFDSPHEGRIHCQLLLQMPGSHDLVLVNRQGHKVLQLSVGRMLDALDRGSVSPLADIKAYSTALNRAAARLEYCHSDLAAKRRLASRMEAQRQAQAKRQQAAREQAAKARADADRTRRQQAMAEERRRLEREKREREAEERVAQREYEQQRLTEALARVDELATGSSADIPLADGSQCRAQLGMIMPSTGKHLFYDRFGRKVAEWRREQLAELLLEGRAVFYEAEPGFESRLEQIVHAQRKVPVL